MFKTNLKIAWRNLWKNKGYSFINVFGLVVGLAVAIVILLWVEDELTFDQFHKKAGNIFRINSNINTGSSIQAFGYCPAPMMSYGKKEIPGIVDAVRIAYNYNYSFYKYNNKEFKELRSSYVDPAFFSIFDFHLIQGNPAKPFPDRNSVIITSGTAKKFFGNGDPIGKIIVADNKDNFTINGVVEDFKENSSIKYDILYPIEILEKGYQPNDYWKSMEEDWGNFNYQTFLLLGRGTNLKTVEKKLTQLQRQHNSYDKESYYTLQPLSKIHLYNADGNSSAMQTVRIFLTVAVLLLMIACINYVNLSTSRSILRSKEVGIKKVVGGTKAQLFFQFIFETTLLFFISAIIAIGVIYLLIPLYNSLSEKNTYLNLADGNVWKVILIAFVGTLAGASIYPAVLLSSFHPILAIKGKISVGGRNSMFRKILVVAQFVFSVTLITGTIVIGRQLDYIRQKELGYDKSYVFRFYMRDMANHYDAVKSDLLKQPGIFAAFGADNNIIQIGGTTGDTKWDSQETNKMFLVHPMGVDKDFIPGMKLQLIQGNNFSGNASIDSASFILNETAIKEMGLKDPIGKNFTLHLTKGKIIGVLKDFHFNSLKEKIQPAIFYNNRNPGNLYIRTTGKDAQKAIAAVQQMWKKYNADFPFEYHFLDEEYGKMYKSDQHTGMLFNVFAAVAILISCLGLLGLASYTTQVKTKEIGIRKVLGASVSSILNLLTRNFAILVLIAFLIASPISWWAMDNWLQNFAYRVHIGWWIFLLSGSLAILIALLTVSFLAFRAAIANPVRSLRSE